MHMLSMLLSPLSNLMRGSRKLCQGGGNFDLFFLFFLVDEGREGPNTIISGPSSTRQRNAGGPMKWRFAGGPMIAQHWMPAWQLCDFQGIQTSIAKKTYIFVVFQGGPDPLPPSGSAHDSSHIWRPGPLLWIIFPHCLLSMQSWSITRAMYSRRIIQSWELYMQCIPESL